MLLGLALTGAPTEITTVGVATEDDMIGWNETVLSEIGAGVQFDLVVELKGWLMSGQVTPSAHGLMEQQPVKLFVAQENQRNPSGQNSMTLSREIWTRIVVGGLVLGLVLAACNFEKETVAKFYVRGA